MNEEILINVTSREVRAAVLDNGVLQEVLVERASRTGLLGNIYKGRVVRVLPGMQAAFVDIGLARTAFLHARDIRREGMDAATDIRRMLSEGQELLVQVVKEPLGSKGARLSTAITLPSRYLVLLPRREGAGVSSRIDDEAERVDIDRLVVDMLADQAHDHRAHTGDDLVQIEHDRLQHLATAEGQ